MHEKARLNVTYGFNFFSISSVEVCDDESWHIAGNMEQLGWS